MPSLAKGVSLSLGLISTTVRVESARESETSLNQICQGQPGQPSHAPSTLHQKLNCPACGPVVDTSVIKRGRPSGDGFLVVEPAAIEALKSTNAEPYKKSITLGAHPADAFDLETTRGEKMYYLVPDGTPDIYALMVDVVRSSDVALCGLWTPRSVASLFQLKVYERGGNAALVLEERVPAASLKPVPVTGGKTDPDLLTVALAFVPTLVKPLDMAAYDDGFKTKLEELFASVTPVTGLSTGVAATVTTVAPDELMKRLQESLKPVKKAAVRKTAPRKTA
jgi:non-homologous end joining protein Ku